MPRLNPVSMRLGATVSATMHQYNAIDTCGGLCQISHPTSTRYHKRPFYAVYRKNSYTYFDPGTPEDTDFALFWILKLIRWSYPATGLKCLLSTGTQARLKVAPARAEAISRPMIGVSTRTHWARSLPPRWYTFAPAQITENKTRYTSLPSTANEPL